MTVKRKLTFILGMRLDVIRASLVLEKLHTTNRRHIVFIWLGQH